jgi:hypothetical protein
MSPKKTTAAGVVLGLLFYCAMALAAQETLTEAAGREKARRAGQSAEKTKKFTDEDLAKLAKAHPPGKAASAPASSQSQESSGFDDGGPSTPEFWRPAVDGARAEVARREGAVKELEARIQELRADTRPTRLTEPNRAGVIAQEISKLLGELETAKTSVEEAKQALEDLLEEARRAGVPASQLE